MPVKRDEEQADTGHLATSCVCISLTNTPVEINRELTTCLKIERAYTGNLYTEYLQTFCLVSQGSYMEKKVTVREKYCIILKTLENSNI